jgi:hypothetical protein
VTAEREMIERLERRVEALEAIVRKLLPWAALTHLEDAPARVEPSVSPRESGPPPPRDLGPRTAEEKDAERSGGSDLEQWVGQRVCRPGLTSTGAKRSLIPDPPVRADALSRVMDNSSAVVPPAT